jgi:4-hydroxy-4-methyl-2-oxoglutarate aldolase
MAEAPIHPAELEQLRRFSTCVLASAIERFDVRLRNVGFTDSSVECIFPGFPAVIGYAATARIRSSDPPMEGHSYYDRTDWWSHILTIPAPRIVVIEDLDKPPGLGAFVGEVHAAILQALACTALVTNGAVRDVRQVHTTGFQMFAGNVSVSHAYAHVLDFGATVEVGHMKVQPGDLLHGDAHGVQTIPIEVASKVLPVAREIVKKREQIVGLCRSDHFSLDVLRQAVKDAEK